MRASQAHEGVLAERFRSHAAPSARPIGYVSDVSRAGDPDEGSQPMKCTATGYATRGCARLPRSARTRAAVTSCSGPNPAPFFPSSRPMMAASHSIISEKSMLPERRSCINEVSRTNVEARWNGNPGPGAIRAHCATHQHLLVAVYPPLHAGPLGPARPMAAGVPYLGHAEPRVAARTRAGARLWPECRPGDTSSDGIAYVVLRG